MHGPPVKVSQAACSADEAATAACPWHLLIRAARDLLGGGVCHRCPKLLWLHHSRSSCTDFCRVFFVFRPCNVACCHFEQALASQKALAGLECEEGDALLDGCYHIHQMACPGCGTPLAVCLQTGSFRTGIQKPIGGQWREKMLRGESQMYCIW